MNPTSAVPPPIPVGSGVSYQPVNYNQNAVAIPVQPQPLYVVQQPVVVRPEVKVEPKHVQTHYDEEERRRRQQQEEADCLACLQVLCIVCYCLALFAGGR